MDVRPIVTRIAGELGTPIAAGLDARVDRVVASVDEILETAHRLGVRRLGTSERPLLVEVTQDLRAADTPMFAGLDRLVLPDVPIEGRALTHLESMGRDLQPGATWLDLDSGALLPHEVGHGVLNELVPDLVSLPPRAGAWRTARFDRRVVEEAGADVFAALHRRDWMMDLGGVPLRDARSGTDLLANGDATVDVLNDVRAAARSGVDDLRLDDYRLAGSNPHHLSGLLTPAFARVQEGAGWDAAEAVYTNMLARLRDRAGYPIDVPTASRETVRAAHDVLGRFDETALEVRRLLTTNGSMGY